MSRVRLLLPRRVQ
uniref:Uncharacterized protein n=1 Tax=Arundo donax TaxID=35708 RepID=A0A0A9B8U0_ARUDO